MVCVQCLPLSQEVTGPWLQGVRCWILLFVKGMLSLYMASTREELCEEQTQCDEEVPSVSSPPDEPPASPQPSSSSFVGVHGHTDLPNLPKFDEILSVRTPKRMMKTKRSFHACIPQSPTYQRPIRPKATIVVPAETPLLVTRPRSSVAVFTQPWHQPRLLAESSGTSSGSEGTVSADISEQSRSVSSQCIEDSITDFEDIYDLLCDTSSSILSGDSTDLSTNESTLVDEILAVGPETITSISGLSPPSSHGHSDRDSVFVASSTGLSPLVGHLSLSNLLHTPVQHTDMSTSSTMVSPSQHPRLLPLTLYSSSSCSSSNAGSPVLDSTSDEVVKMFVHEEDQGVLKAAVSSEQSRSVLPLLKAELKAKIQLKRCISGEYEEEVSETVEFKEPEAKMTFDELQKRERKKAQNRRAALKSRQRQTELEEHVIERHRKAQNLKKNLKEERQLLLVQRLGMVATLDRHLCTECRLQSREEDQEIICQIQKRKSLYETDTET